MCGICGIVNRDRERHVSMEMLIKMRDALEHRGPDDSGQFVEKNIGLAMRRLKIIDLDTGHQPISNEDKTIWIVFNGEIYNFLELRKELIKKGHTFYTKSDTETIVHLYEERGTSCVKELNGMFAFAIWNSKKRELFLARDRMGQKPLYYKFENGEFIFASEIKSLLQCPSTSRQLDMDSLNEFLTFEYVPAPRSIFKNIKKLPASHLMIVKDDALFIERYWDIRIEGRVSLIDEKEALERIFALLEESVRRHLTSDVPLGVFLSGGIDSSAIAALASRRAGSTLKTFSVSFNEKSFDESLHANLVAEYIGSRHYEMKFTAKDCLDVIPYVYTIVDEPFADASLLPTYILSKFTRNYVTVALSGDGSDELFAGYQTHVAHYFADRTYLHIPFFLRKNILEALGKKLPVSFENFSFDFKVKRFISGIEFSPEIRHQLWMGAFSPEEKNALFSPNAKNLLSEVSGLGPLFKNLEELSGHESLDSQTKILFSDQRLYLQDDILTKSDRASMANSLEVRSPFLDNTIVEFANSLNFDLKVKQGTAKFILKKMLLEKKILPKKIINRPKKGFGIPVAKWINKEIKVMTLDLLSEESIKSGGLFNYAYIKKILKEHFDLRKDNRKLIWTLLMFELWKKKFLD